MSIGKSNGIGMVFIPTFDADINILITVRQGITAAEGKTQKAFGRRLDPWHQCIYKARAADTSAAAGRIGGDFNNMRAAFPFAAWIQTPSGGADGLGILPSINDGI